LKGRGRGIRLAGLRKTTKNLSQDSMPRGRDEPQSNTNSAIRNKNIKLEVTEMDGNFELNNASA
jgi:hypothetical protein